MADDSAPRYNLVACMNDVLDGKAGATELPSQIDKVRQEIAEHRQAFAESSGNLDPDIRQQVDPFVVACQGLLDSYDHALNILQEYVKTGDRHLLVQGSEHVRRLIFQLGRGFNSYRDAVLIAQGPTDMPNYNLLLQAVKEWREGLPITKLQVLVEQERALASLSLERLADPGTPDLSEVLALKNAFEAHYEHATRLSASVREENSTAIDAGLDELRETFIAIGQQGPRAELAVRSRGPSPSGLVNLIVNTGRRLADGQADMPELANLMRQLKQTVRGAKAQFEIVEQSGGTDKIQPAIEAGRKAFARYEEGFKLVDDFFDRGVVGILQQGLKVLAEASQEHHQAHQMVLDFELDESKIACVKCGHSNPPGRSRCERCSSALPIGSAPVGSMFGGGSAVGESQDPPIVSGSLLRVYEAVNAVTDGSMTLDQFLETISWFEQLVTQHIAEVRPLREDKKKVTPEIEETLQQAEALFEQFKDDTLQGITQFKAYSVDHIKSRLLDGVRLCNKGAQELVRMERALSGTAVASGTSVGSDIIG